MSIQRGELKVLIDLLERDPVGVNACDEVHTCVSLCTVLLLAFICIFVN